MSTRGLKILLLGGTTEGRRAAEALDAAGNPVLYSTRGDAATPAGAHLTHIRGVLDVHSMVGLLRDSDVGLIVDAAHPFASRLHATVAEAAARTGLPAVRYERRFPPLPDGAECFDDFGQLAEALAAMPRMRVLFLTGVNTIGQLRPAWSVHDSYFRILPRDESRVRARQCGFPSDHILYYGDESGHELIRRIAPDVVVTKESGDSGGFDEKVMAAAEYGVRLMVVRRPAMPDGYAATVNGPHGLRRAVERLLPGFYPLVSGLTTGTCATAAALAAARRLLGDDVRTVAVRLPEGEDIDVGIEATRLITADVAEADVIKHAGDDPDVTDGCRITVRVERGGKPGLIAIGGGDGVGRVTLPGLGLEVGAPAINPGPQAMIRANLARYVGQVGLAVTVSVEGGSAIAARTFNPKVGVEGGISIIGTSGIVLPFSHEAFVESLCREVSVARAMGVERLVLNSGAHSRSALAAMYPALPPQAFVHYGNAIGDALRAAQDADMPAVTLGIMIGKAAKLAEGHLDTHSHNVTLNLDFIAEQAHQAGCSEASVRALARIRLAREIPAALGADFPAFAQTVTSLCLRVCADIYRGPLTIALLSPDGTPHCVLPQLR